jgi:hypothetical protein
LVLLSDFKTSRERFSSVGVGVSKRVACKKVCLVQAHDKRAERNHSHEVFDKHHQSGNQAPRGVKGNPSLCREYPPVRGFPMASLGNYHVRPYRIPGHAVPAKTTIRCVGQCSGLLRDRPPRSTSCKGSQGHARIARRNPMMLGIYPRHRDLHATANVHNLK